MRKKYNKIMLIVIFLIAIQMNVKGQYSISSPYSKYGIGNTNMVNEQVTASMGGVGYAFARNNVVNFHNPASLFATDTLSFIFDIGYTVDWTRISTNANSSHSFLGNISNISFAFPITKDLKMAIGLMPISDINYKTTDSITKVNVGSYTKTYEGDGGLDKVIIGLAYKPSFNKFLNRFSIGANASYVFGNVYKSTTIAFPDSSYYFNTRLENNYNVSAFNFDFGIQYFQKFKNGDIFGAGLTYSMPIKLPTDNISLYYTFYEYAALEYVQDTIWRNSSDGDIKMPPSIGGGLSYERPNKLFLETDFTYTSWDKFKFQQDEENNYLKNNWQLNVGAEYKPNIYGNYLEKMSYRFGFNYDNGYLKIGDNRIGKYGISCGMSFPIKKNGTQVNLNFEYGKLGTKDNNLIQENYYRIGLSISAKDRWFVQRKYQ